MYDIRTSIAIYIIAIYIHLKRHENEYYDIFNSENFVELCNNEKLRLIIMEDIESVAKDVRNMDDPDATVANCTIS